MKNNFFYDLFMIMITISILTLTITFLEPLFIAKAVENNAYSPKATFEGFYEQERQSIDVLFLGTSHCYNAFSPNYLYAVSGINSYNLGSSMQSMIITYYWLKEACRFQKPDTVVVEVYNVFAYQGYSSEDDITWNSTEPQIRQALDFMRWSDNKLNIVKKVSEKNDGLLSYFFPIIRYHDRWEELKKEDYNSECIDAIKKEKGFKKVYLSVGNIDYEPFEVTEDKIPEDDFEINVNEKSLEYLEHIMNFCKEKKIRLILVRTPELTATKDQNIFIKNLANANDVKYYDFNEKELYEGIKYDICKDNFDGGHANYSGAKKITEYLAEVLLIKE